MLLAFRFLGEYSSADHAAGQGLQGAPQLTVLDAWETEPGGSGRGLG